MNRSVNAIAHTAHHVSRHVIGDNPVGAFCDPLGNGVGNHVVGLRRKTDQQTRPVGARAKFGEEGRESA
jgi:hypothetical protein